MRILCGLVLSCSLAVVVWRLLQVHTQLDWRVTQLLMPYLLTIRPMNKLLWGLTFVTVMGCQSSQVSGGKA